MKTKQKSFILYDSDITCIKYLSDKQAGILFKAINALREDDELPDMGTDPALLILFHQISTHMSMNEEKYQKICEQRAKSANKRWSQKENVQNDANASVCIQESTERCYNDNEIDIDIDNKNDNVIDIVNEIENDNDNENEKENDIDNENDAFSMNAKKEEENKKLFYDMSSVESFFSSATAIANQRRHQGTS